MTEDELLALAKLLRTQGLDVRLCLVLAAPHTPYLLTINAAGPWFFTDGIGQIRPFRSAS